MNTSTISTDFDTMSTREYRGYQIAKAVSYYSDRQVWVFSFEGRDYFANTLKRAKVMIDCAIEL
jgi:hypothetical protein